MIKLSKLKMKDNKKHLIQDIFILILSTFLTIFAVKSGLFHNFVLSLGQFEWLGVILTGAFFTSIFTTVPSIVLLGTFSETISLPVLALLAGFGAMIGDYVIFRFVRDRMVKDFEYLFTISRRERLSTIFKNNIFKFFLPFIGALVIASPLPDELGVAMLGTSKIGDRIFFPLVFAANSIGIFIVIWLSQIIIAL